MSTRLDRVVACLLVAGLAVAGVVECAGQVASSAAPMICCAGDGCPMHGSSEHGRAPGVMPTQAANCCVLSPSGPSAPSSPASSLGTALVTSPDSTRGLAPVPAVSIDIGRAHLPPRGSHVPRHVLLSVFLI